MNHYERDKVLAHSYTACELKKTELGAEIPMAIESLEQTGKMLTDAVFTLERRLSIVMLPDSPSAVGGAAIGNQAPQPLRAPITDRLVMSTAEMQRAINAINDIMNRLAV